MAFGDSSSIDIEINVVDGSGTVSTLNATTAAVEKLGTAGTVAGAQLGAVGSGAQQAVTHVQQLGTAGTTTGATVAAGMATARTQTASVGTTATQAAQQITAMGVAGTVTGAQVSAGMQQIGGHALTSLDNVRLLRDDIGVRIPRSMEKAIASSQLLSGAIAGVGGFFLALGAVEIFAHIAESIYNAFEKYIDLNAGAEEYYKTVQKTATEDFGNTRSIEDTKARIDEATSAARSFEDTGKEIQGGAWKQLFASGFSAQSLSAAAASIFAGKSLSDAGYQQQGQADALLPKQIEQQHQLNDLKIEAAHAGDAALQGEAKISAELAKQIALHAEDKRFNRQQDLQHGNKSVAGAGDEEESAQNEAARAQASAQSITLARTERDAVIQAQNEATNAGLEGVQLLHAQQEEAIATITRKMHDGALSEQAANAETAAARRKYLDEEIVLIQKQDAETQKLARDAQQAGLTGIAKIQAEHDNSIESINSNRNLTPDNAASQRAAAQQVANQKMLEEEKQYQEQVKQLDERTSSYLTSGYAKIDSELEQHIDRRVKAFQKMYGQMSSDDARYVAAQAAEQQDITNYQAQAERERVAEHQKSMAQIQATEIAAARVRDTEDKAATNAILDEYNQRVTKARATLEQELNSNKLTADELKQVWSEYYATIKADADLAGAQMEKAAQQTRDRVATSLKDLFTDPAGFIEKQAEEMMYKVLANGLLSATNNLQSDAGKWIAQLLGLGPNLAAPLPTGAAGQQSDPQQGNFGGIIKNLFGGGQNGTAGQGASLSTAGSTLTTAGTGLTTAGTTLNSSSTGLLSAATALQSAAASLSAVQATGGAGGGGGGLGSVLSGLSGGGSGDTSGDGGGGVDSAGFGSDSVGGSLTGQADASSSGDSGIVPFASTDATAGVGSGDLAAAQSAASSSSAAVTAAGGASSLGQGIGIAGAAIGGGVALYNAFENSSPGTGALQGGLAGAAIGTMILPGIGTAVGAVVGAAAGAIAGFLGELFGDNGKGKAQDYDKNTVAPGLAAALKSFNSGQSTYDSATKALDSILTQAQAQTQPMGSGARHYYTDTIVPEVAVVQKQLDAEEGGGRSLTKLSAAQFHTGGLITGFGDLGTGGMEGFIHAMQGEVVMNTQAAMTHAPMLSAMNAGTNFMPMMTGSAASISGGGTTRLGSGGGGDGMPITLNLSAIDAASFARQLRSGGMITQIQGALNQAVKGYGGKALGN